MPCKVKFRRNTRLCKEFTTATFKCEYNNYSQINFLINNTITLINGNQKSTLIVDPRHSGNGDSGSCSDDDDNDNKNEYIYN